MLRKEFAERLRAMRKESGIRQKELAEELGLSYASVSQFMNGVSLPNMEQLNKMLKLMNIPLVEAGKIRFQLMLARSSGPRTISLEKIDGVTDLTKNPDHGSPGFDTIPEWNDLADPDLVFAAPSKGKARGIPLLSLDDLSDYRPKTSLTLYAQDRMREVVIRDFGSFNDVIVIQTDGNRLDMAHCSKLQLAVTNELPEDCLSLRLCRCVDGSWTIDVPDGDEYREWRNFLPESRLKYCKLEWYLPVLEMTMVPVYKKIEDQD